MKLPAWLRKAPPPSPPPSPAAPEWMAGISAALARTRAPHTNGRNPYALGLAGSAQADPFVLPTYPKGVLPDGKTRLAMDAAGPTQYVMSSFGYANGYGSLWAEGIGFMGYPYLAELMQRPEYRTPCEVMGEEMTRKWLKVKAKGDEDKTDRIAAIEDAFARFNVRRLIHDLVALAEGLGRAQIYMKFDPDEDDVIKLPLRLRKQNVKPGSLKGFVLVDPTWTAPNDYNAQDPLSSAFYRPQTWFVMGRLVHASRLLTLIPHPVPQIILPAYNFGGLSLAQMMKPYVDNWLRTRQSVSDLIQAFTVFVLETDMQALVQGGNPLNEMQRAELFANLKNNLGLMLVDKGKEGFQNVSAPLGGLDHLQAQAQEHMAMAGRLPLVKLTGITPSGLNATSDGEIRVFYDMIGAKQQRHLSPIIDDMMASVQLNEFGDVDPDISHEWVPLYQLDEAGQAAVKKTEADTALVWITANVISPDEARTALAADPESPYAGLEGPAPEPEAPPPMGGNGGDPTEQIDRQAEEGSTSGANAGDAAFDEFHEEDHPPGAENQGGI